MGVKVNLFVGASAEAVYYLTSPAYDFYRKAGTPLTVLKNNVPDDVINIFNLQRAFANREAATYQELLNYFISRGFSRDTAVKEATSKVGITKEQMVEFNEKIQIAQKQDSLAKIAEAESLIKAQTDTQKTTFEEIDLNHLSKDSPPIIDFETVQAESLRNINLSSSKGELEKEAISRELNEVNFMPEPKTREINKIDVVKDNNITTIATKSDNNENDFKSFGVNTIHLAIAGAIVIGLIGTSLYLSGKKK